MIQMTPRAQASATVCFGMRSNKLTNSSNVPTWIGWRTWLYIPLATSVSWVVGLAALNRIVASATRIIRAPAAIINHPSAMVTVVDVNNVVEGTRAARRNPMVHTGMPRTFLSIKVAKAPRLSPHQRENAVVEALARLEANPSSKGARKKYIGNSTVVVMAPNAGTERGGPPTTSELATEVARPHSLQ